MLEDWIRVQLSRMSDAAVAESADAQAEMNRLSIGVEARPQPVEQRIQNLLVNVPPGTGKSRVLGVCTPAWMWTRWPSWRAIFLSANPRVAMRDSVLCRDVIESRWYQETFQVAWHLKDDQNAKGLYWNSAAGFRQASGFSAKVVGDRADALVIDDPNDAKEVHSPAERDDVNQRWSDSISNRVNDERSSVRIGIQQRMHEQDWSGHVLATEPGRWEHLRLPMEYERRKPGEETVAEEGAGPGCPCASCRRGHTAIGWRDPRTQEGELLDPVRYPERVLVPKRAQSYFYAGQYQQRPSPAAGGLFKRVWWRFWRYAWQEVVPELAARTVIVPDRFDDEALSWDCAFVKTEGSSLVAGGHWGRAGPDKYLLHLFWERATFTETRDALEEQAMTYPNATAILVENKANGPAVIESLRSKVSGIIPIEPKGGKEARAAATSPMVDAGNVIIPLHAEWRDRYIEQHATFPKGAQNDAVDQQSQMLQRWIGNNFGDGSALVPGGQQRRM